MSVAYGEQGRPEATGVGQLLAGYPPNYDARADYYESVPAEASSAPGEAARLETVGLGRPLLSGYPAGQAAQAGYYEPMEPANVLQPDFAGRASLHEAVGPLGAREQPPGQPPVFGVRGGFPEAAGPPGDFDPFLGPPPGQEVRASVYAGRIPEAGELPEYETPHGSALLADAGEVLGAAPGRGAGGLGLGGDPRSAGEPPYGGDALEEEEGTDEEIQDSNKVYITDYYKDWECQYLRRVARGIHRLVCAQLNHSSEEALFMFFIEHDKDMDGVVGGEEATKLLEVIERVAPGSVPRDKDGSNGELVASDGSISFVALLNWYSGTTGGRFKDTTPGFNMTSFFVGLLGSGMVHCDKRLDNMDWAGLRRNVLGYRRLLEQLRQLQLVRALRPAQTLESREGLLAAMPAYYHALSREFEGDDEHLFEIFNEADTSGNLVLEAEEVATLLRRLDKGASEQDLKVYLSELNISDGPLTFASFLDWWDQARNVSNSRVAEKGAGFLAGVRSEAFRKKVGNIFFETAVQRQWRQANQVNRLTALRKAYCQTLSEVRKYKIETSLRKVEALAAHW